jgi:hypothetical protein
MDLVRLHDTVVRKAFADSDGREVKHTGDGIMASFVSAVAAIKSATQVARDLARHRQDDPECPLHVRILPRSLGMTTRPLTTGTRAGAPPRRAGSRVVHRHEAPSVRHARTLAGINRRAARKAPLAPALGNKESGETPPEKYR